MATVARAMATTMVITMTMQMIATAPEDNECYLRSLVLATTTAAATMATMDGRDVTILMIADP